MPQPTAERPFAPNNFRRTGRPPDQHLIAPTSPKAMDRWGRNGSCFQVEGADVVMNHISNSARPPPPQDGGARILFEMGRNSVRGRQ